MVEPATAAIAVLSTIAGVSGYGAMKLNANQALVMDETANRLAAEKIEKVRRELSLATQQMKSQAERELKKKQDEVDKFKRDIAALEAAKLQIQSKLQQATEGERLFASVSLPGFKKAIDTFQKQRAASDGDEAMGEKTATALKKVFDNYTSSARLTISRGSLNSLYQDLSKAVGKEYMNREEFDRTLTDILRSVDASLQGDKSVAEAKKAENEAAKKAAAAEAATAAATLKTTKKAEAAALKETKRAEAAALKETQKAEKEAAKKAAAEKAVISKLAADKQASTQIHDTLMKSMKDALEWYNTTIDEIEKKQKNELKVFLSYAPKDDEIKDMMSETTRYLGFLIKYRNLLKRKYEVYKGKIGTKKFSLVKYMRGQDNEFKPLDESFYEKEPKPLPVRALELPIVGGRRIRKRKGGALESLIASKKDIDVEIDFFGKVKAHLETYLQKLNDFIRRKRTEIQELGLQPQDEEDAVTLSREMRETPDTAAKAAVFGKKPEDIDETAFTSVNPMLQPKSTTRRESADRKVVNSLKGFQSPLTKKMNKTRRKSRYAVDEEPAAAITSTTAEQEAAAGTGLISAREYDRVIPSSKQPQTGIGKNNETLNVGDRVSCTLYSSTKVGNISRFITETSIYGDIQYVISDTPTGMWKLPTNSCEKVVQTDAAATERTPLPLLGLPLAKRKSPLELGGPLPRGGLRKKKLRTRRGGKQRNHVRRTRRS